MSEQKCGMEVQKIIRGGSKDNWYSHSCEKCKLVWVAPMDTHEGFVCREEFRGRYEKGCKHVGKQRFDHEGNPDTVECECKKKNIRYEIYECDKHKRCLPTMNASNTMLHRWNHREESKIYKSCQDCPDYEKK